MEQVRKSHSEKAQVEEVAPSATSKKDTKVESDKRLADDLLDEIDALLEENAQAFVAQYVQKGGE